MIFLFDWDHLSHHLQPYNRDDQCDDEKQAPERGRFVKEKDTQKHRSHRADAGPHGIGGTDGQGLHGLGQQQHAQSQADQKTGSPQIELHAGNAFHLAQTKGKARFKAAGNDQDYPTHTVVCSVYSTHTAVPLQVTISMLELEPTVS